MHGVTHVQQKYNLRSRPHNQQLLEYAYRLINCNFIIRLLYRHSYWHFTPFYCILLLPVIEIQKLFSVDSPNSNDICNHNPNRGLLAMQ